MPNVIVFKFDNVDWWACPLGLSNIIILAIYFDILEVSTSWHFIINYRDIMPAHYRH